MKRASMFSLLALFLLSCSGLQLVQPTPTVPPSPTLTATVTPTYTPIPTFTPTLTTTPDPAAKYLPLLPEIPSGFAWKIMPERKLAVLIPDGWFFKEETHDDLKLEAIYVSKENIDEVGRFSSGLTVFIFKDFENDDEAEQFGQDLLSKQTAMETTKEVLKTWDHKAGTFRIHHLRIRAEYPKETEENRKKIVHYMTLAANHSVYWAVFESPENLWEQTIEQYGLVLDYIIVFGD